MRRFSVLVVPLLLAACSAGRTPTLARDAEPRDASSSSDASVPSDASGSTDAAEGDGGTIVLRRLLMSVADLLSDPVRGVLYASELSGTGDAVAVIDPATGTVQARIQVGSEPGPLAMSDDGKYLYVGLTRDGAVRRVDLEARTADLQFSLGADDFNGVRTVKSIVVVPGQPHTVVVTRQYQSVSPDFAGLVVYDDGVARPRTVERAQGTPGDLAAADASTFFGFDRGSAVLYTLRLAADGVFVSDVAEHLIESPFDFLRFPIRDVFFYDEGLIFSGSGQVVDPYLGRELGRYDASGPVLPLSRAGKTYVLGGANGGQLQAFDRTRFASAGAYALDIQSPAGIMASLQAWSGGVAFHTRFAADEEAVYFVSVPGFENTASPDAGVRDSGVPINDTTWLAPTGARIGHLAFDESAQHLYASNATLDRIEDYSIAEHRFLDPIPLTPGAEPVGFDLAPDGHTLYVANRGNGTISVLDLDQHRELRTIALPVDPRSPRAPYYLAIAANGHALVTTTFNGTGLAPIYELDLSSEQFTARTDFGYTTEATEVVASEDKSAIAIVISGISPGAASIYRSSTGALSPPVSFDWYVRYIGIDARATRILVDGRYLLDADLHRLGEIENSATPAGSRISQDCVFGDDPAVAYRPGPDALETLDLLTFRRGNNLPLEDTILKADNTVAGGRIATRSAHKIVAVTTQSGIAIRRLP